MTPRFCIVISAGMIALSFLQIAVQGYSAPLNTVPPASSDVYHMELPGRDWAVEVGLPDFVIQQEEVQAHAQGAMSEGTVLFTFSFLTNSEQAFAQEQFLRLLSSLN